MRILILLLAALPALAATCTTTNPATSQVVYLSTASWDCGHTPNTSDTADISGANISNFVVDGPWEFGTSPSDGTTYVFTIRRPITINAAITVRGNISQLGGTTTTWNNGAAFLAKGDYATTPSATDYVWYAATLVNPTWFVVNGTGNRNSVTFGKTAATHSYSFQPNTYNFAVNVSHATFSDCGTATIRCIVPSAYDTVETYASSFNDVLFLRTGGIDSQYNRTIWHFTDVEFRDTLSASCLSKSDRTESTFVRVKADKTFMPVAVTYGTFTDSYFPQGPGGYYATPVNASRSLLGYNVALQRQGDGTENVWIELSDQYNPKFVTLGVAPIYGITSTLFESTSDNAAGTNDNGDCIMYYSNPASLYSVPIRNNVFTIGGDGHQVCNVLTPSENNATNLHPALEHNTHLTSVYAVVDFENKVFAPNTLTFRSNLLGSGLSGSYYKIMITNRDTQSTDPCVDAAACNYNVCYGCSSGAGVYTNSGLGYVANFTSPKPGTGAGDIGQYDLSMNPLYVDVGRNMGNFDQKYLGRSVAATWSASGTYAYGDLVSLANATLWKGQTINFRCNYTAGCNGPSASSNPRANSQPGGSSLTVGSEWRTYWEFASLAELRDMIPIGGCHWNDASLGAVNDCGPAVYRKWVFQGAAPQNASLIGYTFVGDTNTVTNPGAVPVARNVAAVAGW